jgi:hypothetical protein
LPFNELVELHEEWFATLPQSSAALPPPPTFVSNNLEALPGHPFKALADAHAE